MIEANFEGQEMSLQYDGVISDSIRFLKIHFNFDEYWDGFEKTAVFSHNGEKFLVALSEGNSIYLDDNTCYVPQEVIKTQSFSVSVFGNKGNTVITSSNEDVSVADSGMGKRIPRDPTPTAWSQMLEIENHTNNMVSELVERADSGEFDGVGIPQGGTAGQVLKKSSNADYDTEWGEITDCYTKEQSDNKYVAKTTTVNGKQLSGNIVLNYSDVGAYSKPSVGIPKSDLSSAVKASLDKADTALQSHQDISGKADKTYVDTGLSNKVNKEQGKGLFSGSYNDLTNKPDIPTKTSVLTNDSGFITNAVNNLINYYLKSETYNKTEINSLISQIQTSHFEIVAVLPTVGERNVIYLLPRQITETGNIYDEYIYISNAYEKIGSTDVDLTGYATETWVNTQIADFLTQMQIQGLINNALNDYYNKSEIDTALSLKENLSNKVTSISSQSTDTQYPSAKCVYNIVGNIESLLSALR